MPSKATQADESWSARIIPSDGLEHGSMVETDAVTVQNIETTFDSITIFPSDANVDDILKVEFVTTEDEYISFSNTSVSYEWFINDIAVPNSDQKLIRLDMEVGDIVHVVLNLVRTDGSILAKSSSKQKTIKDVEWHIFDLMVDGLFEAINITDLEPTLEWQIYKSTATNELPAFFRILVTKTPSRSGPIFDTGNIQYTKNSFVIPKGNLSRGQNYFLHVGVSDTTPIPDANYTQKEINLSGSSWSELVSNKTG